MSAVLFFGCVKNCDVCNVAYHDIKKTWYNLCPKHLSWEWCFKCNDYCRKYEHVCYSVEDINLTEFFWCKVCDEKRFLSVHEPPLCHQHRFLTQNCVVCDKPCIYRPNKKHDKCPKHLYHVDCEKCGKFDYPSNIQTCCDKY